MSEPKTSERRLAAVSRQRQALELRAAGHRYEEIASRLGYRGRNGAYKAVMAGIQRTLQEPAEVVRKMELHRLDQLWRAVWPKVAAGELPAVDRALRIMERRAAYLGLDAPKAIKMVGFGRSGPHRRAIPKQTTIHQPRLRWAGPEVNR